MSYDHTLQVYLDRYDENYQNLLAELLSPAPLLKDAEEIKPGDPLYGSKYQKRISIKFCGLSGLSIMGGADGRRGEPRSQAVNNFLDLIRNRDGVLKQLNEQGVCLDVKLIFAYPYSDFMYDLIQAEYTHQHGFSMECVLNGKKAKTDLGHPQKLGYSDLKGTEAFRNLRGSLDKLQEAVNESLDRLNCANDHNRVIVKFTPLNILVCFLKINNHIFTDPYLYAKNQRDGQGLSLRSPITHLSVGSLPSLAEVNGIADRKQRSAIQNYASLISHFRYLWRHPLTMYSTDATDYVKNKNRTLFMIKEPDRVSYLGKAKRIERDPSVISDGSSMDLWKQDCKNELLRYCSKFLASEAASNQPAPIPVFIAGTWTKSADGVSGPSEFMIAMEEFLKRHFGADGKGGLPLQPWIVNAADGETISDEVFRQLRSARLGIVILTRDVERGAGKPNIFFERGYLTGKLGKRQSRKASSAVFKDQVFVLRQKKAREAGDTNNIAITEFSGIDNFRLQLFRFVKWLWDVTELNSDYAIKVINELAAELDSKVAKKGKNNLQLKQMAIRFVDEIRNWEKDYNDRYKS